MPARNEFLVVRVVDEHKLKKALVSVPAGTKEIRVENNGVIFVLTTPEKRDEATARLP